MKYTKEEYKICWRLSVIEDLICFHLQQPFFFLLFFYSSYGSPSLNLTNYVCFFMVLFNFLFFYKSFYPNFLNASNTLSPVFALVYENKVI